MPNMSQRDIEISDDDASEDEYTVDPDMEYGPFRGDREIDL
jgi:hypothetical protein